jgi:hypothetical protein
VACLCSFARHRSILRMMSVVEGLRNVETPNYVLLLLLLLLFVIFMQCIYDYILEKPVFLWYNVAADLQLTFMVPAMLFPVMNVSCFYIGTFQYMCPIPNKDVFCIS